MFFHIYSGLCEVHFFGNYKCIFFQISRILKIRDGSLIAGVFQVHSCKEIWCSCITELLRAFAVVQYRHQNRRTWHHCNVISGRPTVGRKLKFWHKVSNWCCGRYRKFRVIYLKRFRRYCRKKLDGALYLPPPVIRRLFTLLFSIQRCMFFFLQWVTASASGAFGAHCHRWVILSSDTFFFFDNACFISASKSWFFWNGTATPVTWQWIIMHTGQAEILGRMFYNKAKIVIWE